jgi:hypothetical protein
MKDGYHSFREKTHYIPVAWRSPLGSLPMMRVQLLLLHDMQYETQA